MTISSEQIEQIKKYLFQRAGRLVEVEKIDSAFHGQEFENLFQRCLQINDKVGQEKEVTALLAHSILTDKIQNITPFIDWFFKEKVLLDHHLSEQILFKEYAKYQNSNLYKHYEKEVKNFSEDDIELNSSSRFQRNFIVFSMVLNLSEIEESLTHFPSYGDQIENFGEVYQRGRACTVAWSGIKTNNVPVVPWNSLKVGIVVDPQKIDAPYGDMIACGSYDIIPKEDTKLYFKSQVKEDSKYTGKIVVKRANKIITNQARIIKNLDGHEILEEGRIEVFADNVWRKFIKRNVTSTNEVLCIRKQNAPNPVVGLMLDVTDFIDRFHGCFVNFNEAKDRTGIIEILQDNSHLNLYIYDRRQEEHIVRVVDNSEAISLMKGGQNFDQKFVAMLRPFSGFDSDQKQEPSECINLKSIERIRFKPHDLKIV